MTGDPGFDAFVISLERSPERLAAFRQMNHDLGLTIGRLAAYDGRRLDRDKLVEAGLIAPGLQGYSPGSLGSALSHRALWRRARQTGRAHLVFEDDAVIRRDVASVLPRLLSSLAKPWDILLLGYNTDSILDVQISRGFSLRGQFWPRRPGPEDLAAFAHVVDPVGAYPLANAFGLCGYAISPAGAEILLQRCFPLDNRVITIPTLRRSFHAHTFDSMINDSYAAVRAYACLPPLVMTANDARASSTTAGRSPRLAVDPAT